MKISEQPNGCLIDTEVRQKNMIWDNKSRGRNLKYPLLIKHIRYGFKLQSSWNLFYPLISLGFKQEKLE